MARGMLDCERDEDEAHAEQAQLIPGDRVFLVEPLERRRVVEGESRLREPLADLGAERFRRSALRGRKLAPQEIANARVEVAKAALDGELQAALRLGRFGGRHTAGP